MIQQEINSIFQRMGLSFIEGSMVSVSSVKVTPDLLEARIYISVFKAEGHSQENEKRIMKKLEERQWEIKKELTARIKNQLRRMPELKFFLDDTLDYVFKMEEVFKKIKEEEKGREGDAPDAGKEEDQP